MNNSWDDIRFVLAVVKTGSLNAAAAQLGVTHATVLRRVAAFEASHKRKIFERSQSGYSLLPEAEPILRAALNVEEAVLAIDRAIVGAQQTLRGPVRIASTDSLCNSIMPQIITTISDAYPDITLSLLSSNTRHDFHRMDSDIAVRPTTKLSAGLVGEIAGYLEFRAYRSENSDPGWLGVEGPLSRSQIATWMHDNVPSDHIKHRADSFYTLKKLAIAGLGQAILPRIIAEPETQLMSVAVDGLPLSVPVWVALLEDLSSNARFRVVQRMLLQELSIHLF